MKNSVFFFVIAFVFFSCTNNKTVKIRVRNASAFSYDSVVVNTSGGENYYGTILSNQVSEYKTFDFAYKYAYVSLYIDTVRYQLIPIDYVGELKIPSGKYTYRITVSDTVNRQLGIMLIED